MQSLLQLEGRSVLKDPQTLKLLIAPILAHNREEQQKFYRVFEDYWEESKALAELRLQQRKEEVEELEEQINIVRRNTLPGWLIGSVLALIVGIGLFGIWTEVKESFFPRIKPHFKIITPDERIYPDTSLSRLEMRDTVNANGQMQDELHFHYQAGEAPDGLDPHALIWTIGETEIRQTDPDSFGNHITWICSEQGVLWVSLTVFYANQDHQIDSLEKDQFHAQIQVGCPDPLRADFVFEPKEPKENEWITLRPSPDSTDIYQYKWNFGDGETSTENVAAHRYEAPGEYRTTLSLKRIDTTGFPCQDSAKVQHIISVNSNLPKTELATDLFPLKRDETGQVQSRLSDWSLILISLGITLFLALLGLLLRLWVHQKRLRQQDEKFAVEEESPFTIPFPSQDHLIAPEKGIYDLASLMRQRRIGNIQEINLPMSIDKTIQESGLPVIHFDTWSRPSEYLILIDQRHPDSHLARFFGRISEILEGEDVLLDTFYYDKDPRYCWNVDYPEGLSLEQLRQQYRKHRLILFTSGYHLIDSYDSTLLPWFAPAFEIWKENRLILTPIPVADWGYQEQELMKEIDVLPLDIPGQMQMIEMFDDIGQPEFQEHKKCLLHTFPAAAEGIEAHDLETIEGLQAYLGPDLFSWVAATSVYPLPNWEITLAIGHKLTISPRRDRWPSVPTAPSEAASQNPQYLLTFDNLLKLARIPWLQDGDLPLRLRLRLIESLDPETEREARQAVLDLLSQVQVRPGSFIAHKVAIQEVTHQFFLTPGDKEIAEQMYYLMQQDKLADPVVRKRLQQELELLDGEVARNYLHQRFGAIRPRELLMTGGLILLLGFLLFRWMNIRLEPTSQQLELSPQTQSSFWMDRQLKQDSAVIWNNRAVVQAEEFQNLTEAQDLLNRARTYRNNKGGYPLADSNVNAVQYRLGVAAFNAGQYLDAIPTFDRVSTQPDSMFWRSLGARALAYYHIGQRDRANAYLDSLLLLNPTFANQEFANLIAALGRGKSYDFHIARALRNFEQAAYPETMEAADSALFYREADSLALALRHEADSLYQLVLEFVPFAGHTDLVWSVAFSPDGRRMLTGSQDNKVKLWDLQGNEIQTFDGHTDFVLSVAFSLDGSRVLTGSDDQTAKLWDLQGNEIQTFDGHRSQVNSVAFSPDVRRVLTGSADQTAKLWDLQGNEIQTFDGHSSGVSSVAFSPDGSRVLTGSWDQTAKLWDLQGNQIQTFAGHSSEVYSVAFSPDGNRVLTGSGDQTAKLWDLQGNQILIFDGHMGSVFSVAFSPDGSRVLTGSADQTAKLWDLQGNQILSQTFAGHTDYIRSVAFSPDGRKIANSVDKTVSLYDISSVTSAPQALRPNMVSIPGGSFRMGGISPQNGPPHFVTVSSFELGETEVTNAQFAAFLNAEGNRIDWDGDPWIDLDQSRIREVEGRYVPQEGYEQHPVVQVTWHAAVAYCQWLGADYRLPSEAEWEYAARGENFYAYPGTNDREDLSNYAVFQAEGTAPVASKLPVAKGIGNLYDMAGNVWEWCQDYWHDDYEGASLTSAAWEIDPDDQQQRVVRGASWMAKIPNAYALLDLTHRGQDPPGYRSDNTGFRVARGKVPSGLFESEVVDMASGRSYIRLTEVGTVQAVKAKNPKDIYYCYHKTLPIGSKVLLAVPGTESYIQLEVHAKLRANNPHFIGLGSEVLQKVFSVNKASEAGRVQITYPKQEPIPTMIRVQGGTFLMGSEDGADDEKPVHPVTLSDFEIAETEVTYAQYAAFLNVKGQEADSVKHWIDLPASRLQQNGNVFTVASGFEQHPAAYISWYGATAYCRWLSERTGETWQLPTEAQWEYAAGGGVLGRDSIGQRLHMYAGHDKLDTVGWYTINANFSSHPVASKAPNELGLYDMSGNAWEWCSDWYDSYPAFPPENYAGPLKGSSKGKANRGGSWINIALDLRVTNRSNGALYDTNDRVGFRPVRTP